MIKNSILFFIENWKINLLTLVIVPIFLGAIYGKMYEKMLEPLFELNVIDVFTEYIDSELNSAVDNLLDSPAYSFVNKHKIKENEMENKLTSNPKSIGILTTNNTITVVNRGEMTVEKSIIINGIKTLSINANTNNNNINTCVIEPIENLTSIQKMQLSLFSGFTLFITVFSAGAFIKNREKRVLSRLDSMNISKNKVFWSEVIAYFICSLMVISLYLVLFININKLTYNLLNLIFIIIIQSMLAASVGAIAISIFKKEKTFSIFFYLPVLFIMFLGGTFFPIDIFNIIWLAKLMPNYNLTKIYESVFINKSIFTLSNNMLLLLLFTVILITIGRFKFTLKEVD